MEEWRVITVSWCMVERSGRMAIAMILTGLFIATFMQVVYLALDDRGDE